MIGQRYSFFKNPMQRTKYQASIGLELRGRSYCSSATLPAVPQQGQFKIPLFIRASSLFSVEPVQCNPLGLSPVAT